MAIDPADEDEYATDSDEDDEDDEEKEEEVHMKPIFIPKVRFFVPLGLFTNPLSLGTGFSSNY